MDATRFDRVAKLFAARRLSRRQALARGGAGLAAGALAAAGLTRQDADAQDAPDATPAAGEVVDLSQKTAFLFVQSFRRGSVAPKEGEDGTFTLTLDQGLGQTIYFSDRPARVVGAAPTPQFLEGLGFSPDNPPNAALVVDDGAGGTNIAVVELANPLYDPLDGGVTYDVQVLADWEQNLAVGFSAAPADLSALPAIFGPAHLFIDDCADQSVHCCSRIDPNDPWGQCAQGAHVGDIGPMGFCWDWGNLNCNPCVHGEGDRLHQYYYFWGDQCNKTFPACNGHCAPAAW